MPGRLAFSIVLDPGGPKTRKAMLVDGSLPVEEFVDTEGVAGAGLLKREQTPAYGRDHLSLAADNPTTCSFGREIGDR